MGGDCMSGGENAVVDNPNAQMLDVFPRQSGNDFVSLALLCSCEAFNKRLQFADGEILFKKKVGDAEGMEKVEETLEVDIFGLVEASLQEESVFGDT